MIVVVSSAFLVSATNLTAGRDSSGFLFGYFGSKDNFENPLEDKMYLKTNKKTNLALAPLAEASSAPDPKMEADEIGEEVLMDGQAMVASTAPVSLEPEEDGGLKIYEVQPGDTVSEIASQNGISVNTILWANELDNVNSIMPGDKIFILPVSGLSHIVAPGENIDSISQKYKAEKEKIIAFNELPANGEIKEGQEIVIPGGEKEIPRARVESPSQSSLAVNQRQYESFESAGKKLSGRAGTGHKFPYGYCTWYVAQRKYVPWGGNAGTWLYRAKAMGYATGKSPKVGSIIVTSESWWGHVGIVEKVSGSSVTISEMNHKGFAVKSTRTIDAKNRVIKGYIYSD